MGVSRSPVSSPKKVCLHAFALAVLIAAGCSSSPASAPVIRPEASPCATKGATYLEQFAELSGNCGPLQDTTFAIGADGTPSDAASFACTSASSQGCVVTNNGCRSSLQGVNCTVTTKLTFSSDGASGSGTETLACTANGTACVSTYSVTDTRQ
jgi:hypothetical protein